MEELVRRLNQILNSDDELNGMLHDITRKYLDECDFARRPGDSEFYYMVRLSFLTRAVLKMLTDSWIGEGRLT